MKHLVNAVIWAAAGVACGSKGGGRGAGSGSGSSSDTPDPGAGTAVAPIPPPTPPSVDVKNEPIPEAIADRLGDGRLFVFRTGDAVVVGRLDRHGAVELRRGPAADQAVWTGDGAMLVALQGGTIDHRAATVWRYEQPGARDVAPLELAISGDDAAGPDVPVPGASLARTRDGEVWLRRCLDHDQRVVDRNGIVGCEAWRYRRIAPTSGDDTATAPPGFPADDRPPPAPPRIPPPAGYAVKPVTFTLPTAQQPDGVLHHVGWACTAPDGTTSRVPDASWSDFDHYTGKAVRWLQATPPIYQTTGLAVSLIGERHLVEHVFVACRAQPLSDYRTFGGGVWGELTDEGWVIRVDTTDVATVEGMDLDAAPASAPVPVPVP